MDSVRTLSSVGAGELILKCSVIDIPTSVLLTKAGALLQDTSLSDDFIYLCCVGDLERVKKHLPSQIDSDLSLGLLAASSRGRLQICRAILQYRPQKNPSRAGHREIVSRLLEANATVDRKDSEDRTALMAAAFMDHWEIVDLLLDHGASISETDSAGATALHLALSNGSKSEAHDKTVRTLIRRGSDLSTADAHGRVCIHLAAYHGDKNLPSLFGATCVDVQDCLGRTPLMLAASQGQLEAVDQLVKNGAYIDCIDSDGRTAFQLAAIHGHLPVVDMLLALGADEAHKDNDGAVALHYAVAHDDVTLCRALATSVTVHATDRAGNHPLINACQSDNEELLAEHITDWEQHDMDGTPLVHTLLINKQTAMAELLFTLGAFISARDAHGRTCAHVVCAINDLCGARMLRRLAASFEAVDSGGRTPLLTAVWNCHLEMATYLLETVGVNPNSVDEQVRFFIDLAGRTALDVATMYGHDTIRAVLQSASGSADSSGFGSVPNSPLDFRSLGRKSLRKAQKITVTSPRLVKKAL
ncbi:unnamed protein product [Nippostrongylus brasiliensis]|uniref:ANK_REP_REGION domain-containing protein n=1 Tax=Nippostrongylus brasiliensis TaxID=27835 RepID=A0A0N4YSW9_NIPBR|nr:unnamed protein product [Nippostrongylus brasiliensis]